MGLLDRRRVGLLLIGANVGLADFAADTSPTKLTPDKSPAVLRDFPPAAAEQSAPGTGKFVIFTREEAGKGDRDDMAGARECIPSRPEKPVTKRIEFRQSSWNAEPLLNSLANDGSHGLHPRLVTVRVQEPEGHYKVHFYDINYRTWEVRPLAILPWMHTFGVLGDTVYCHDTRKDMRWFRISTETGAVHEGVPLTPITVLDNYWIVKKPGDDGFCWSFDRDLQQFAGRFKNVDLKPFHLAKPLLSADGKCRAFLLATAPSAWIGGPLKAEILVQRDGRAEDLRVPVELTAIAGSGVMVIPLQTCFRFIGSDHIEFRAWDESESRSYCMWMIDIASGRVARSTDITQIEVEENNLKMPDFVVPEYLREPLKEYPHFGREGLAAAFLQSQGFLKPSTYTFPKSRAGVSPDGRHILFMFQEGPLRQKLIYGDLKTKKTVQWDAPAEIDGPALEFLWVETP